MTLDIERERIACVFGLGGGELHIPDERFPDEWDGPSEIAYWYEGAPEYVALGDLGLDYDDELRTAILECLWGYPDPPAGWRQVGSFRSSGEASCWWCGDGSSNEAVRDGCSLCGGEATSTWAKAGARSSTLAPPMPRSCDPEHERSPRTAEPGSLGASVMGPGETVGRSEGVGVVRVCASPDDAGHGVTEVPSRTVRRGACVGGVVVVIDPL